MSEQKQGGSWLDQLPFPKQWLVYIAIKVLVLALVIYLALKWQGLL